MTIPQGRLGGTLAVAVAACLFGTLGPVSRGAYDAGMTPLTFALWRASLGTLGLLAIIGTLTLRGRGRFHWKALDRRTIAALGAAVSAGIVLNLAIFTAFGQMSIALALLGFYTYPALVAIGAVATGEERLTRGRMIALALALLGMAVVVLGGSGGGSGPGLTLAGLGLVLLAAAMQAVYVLLGRRGFPAVPTEEATLVVLVGTAAGYLAVLTRNRLDRRCAGPVPLAGRAAAAPLGRHCRGVGPDAPLPARDPGDRPDPRRDHRADRAAGRHDPRGDPPRRTAGSRAGGGRCARARRRGPAPARRRGGRATRGDERDGLTMRPAERAGFRGAGWVPPSGPGSAERAGFRRAGRAGRSRRPSYTGRCRG